MHLPNNLNLKPTNILKIAGLAIVAVVIVALAVRLVGSSFTSLVSKTGIDQGAPAFNGYGEMAFDKASGGAVGLSVRNVATPAVPPINGDTTVGDNAEEFEVTEYSANIETRQLENTCNEIVALKSRDDVIFENANKYEKSCNYSFKVKRKSVGEILTIIKALDPKELNENTYTIKQQIDDYTSEVEILEKKMSSIEETLSSAIKAYDDITLLATKTKDVESLARSKTEQLDRLDYTYFNVYIVENKFIDGQNLKDSWIAAVKSFVGDINKVIQDITINLAGLLFLVLQYIIYFFIVLIIVKYGWKLTKRIWKK